MIQAGLKPEEYRDISKHWESRIEENGEIKKFDIIRFQRGYSKNPPIMDIECKGISFGYSDHRYCDEIKFCYVIKLGKILTNK